MRGTKPDAMIRKAVILAALAIGLAVPQMAHAQRYSRQGPGDPLGPVAAQRQESTRRDVQAGQSIPMAQVIVIINRRTPGRMLDADSGNMGSQPVYRVRWATNDGHRIDYTIDARTGAILSANGG